VAVAAIRAVVIGLALWVLGVPLLPGRGRVASVTSHKPAAAGPAAGSVAPAVDAVPVLIKRLDHGLPLPARAHPGDAGVDLCAAVDVVLAPGERALVPTGVAIALPEGYAAFVHPRSGLAARHGVTIVNAPGTVDAGYRGEIKVTLLNTDQAQPVRFERGDRIAQLVIQRVACPQFHEVQTLPGSARAAGGFGSTGGHSGAGHTVSH
jgi:dUTP pyrophosphatase